MKHRVAITMGDPAGIGAEITVKALRHPSVRGEVIPVVIGDRAPLADALRITGLPMSLREIASPEAATGVPDVVEYIDPSVLRNTPWAYGQVSGLCGEASFQYIRTGIRLAQEGGVDAVVTGPINKESIHLAGHDFAGHTEIFAHYTDTDDYAMLLCSGPLRVIHVTTHVAMRDACDLITQERVLKTIGLAQQALVSMGIDGGVIGVAGLNPHCSENGLFGSEEAQAIAPAIALARAKGIQVEGPVPPDTVFVKALGGLYAIVVAMYHDQGHIPLKLSGFRMDKETGLFSAMHGVNVTLGLPIIRTSVDHGTAYDRAGKNISNEESMVEAIEMAALFAKNKQTGGSAC